MRYARTTRGRDNLEEVGIPRVRRGRNIPERERESAGVLCKRVWYAAATAEEGKQELATMMTTSNVRGDTRNCLLAREKK